MSRLVVPVLVVSLVLAACGRPQGQQQMPPAAVGFITVAEQPVALTVELPGRTNPFAVSRSVPKYRASLKRLFTEGATVKQGQPLYQIDPRPIAPFTTTRSPPWLRPRPGERYARL